MSLETTSGETIYTWDVGAKSGGGETWWYTAGEGYVLYIKLQRIGGAARTLTIGGSTVATCGKVRSAGTSLGTGNGCTPY